MTFVGRTAQLGLLRERFDVLDSGEPNLALVRGIAGSGKSALVSEFVDRIQEDTAATVAVVSCNQHAEESFSVFKRVVAGLAEGTGDSASDQFRKRAAAMGEAMLEIGPSFVSLVFPPAGLVGDVGKYLLGRARKSRGSSTEMMSGYHDSLREPSSDFVEFFRRAADESVLVVVVDDLHWADEASIALFGRLATELSQTPDLPILLIGSYRGHEVAADDDHTLGSILNQVSRYWGDVVIDLNDVDERERYEFTKRLVETFSRHGLEESFTTELYKRTEGSPLLAQEFLRSMASSGDLVEAEDGVWVAATDLNWNHAPASFDASVAERMKSLTREARTTLNMAAVQGVEFSADIVAAALDRDLDDILAVLSDELGQSSHGFVKDLASTESEIPIFAFRFQHAEYRRFIYDSLTPSIKARSHHKIARAISDFYADFETDMALEIAEHWTKARQPDKAAAYYLKAANTAIEARNLQGARSAAERAIGGSRRLAPEAEAELHLIAGRTNHVLGEFTAATPYLQRALEVSESEDLAQIEAQALTWLGANAWRRERDEDAENYLVSGLRRAREIGLAKTELQALRNLGILARRAGDADRGLSLYEQSEAMARDIGLAAGVTAAMNNRANLITSLRGDFRAARDIYVEALALAEDAGNQMGQSLYLHNLAGEQSRLGDQHAAIETAEEALAMSRSVGNRLRESMSHVDLGEARSRLGHWKDASVDFEKALAISSELQGNHPYEIRALMRLAISRTHTGARANDAIEAARESVRLSEQSGSSAHAWLFTEPSTVLAALLFRDGDHGRALDSLGVDGQVIPSGTDPWWLRWQHALKSTVRAAWTDIPALKEHSLHRMRIATATCSAAGVIADAKAFVELLLPGALDEAYVRTLLAVLDTPPPGFSPAKSATSDCEHLNELASRYRTAMADTRLETFRTPNDRESSEQHALRELESGHSPVFEYEPVPLNIESPLVSLLGDLDPARSIWEALLYESVEDHHDLLVATRSRNATRLTKACIDAFGAPDRHLIREARSLLDSIDRSSPINNSESAESAAEQLRAALVRLNLSAWSVVIDGGMNARMSVSHETNTIRIRQGSLFSDNSIRRLIIHEIGTHVLRAENGRRQPLDLLAMGIGQNAATEEGLASYNEALFGLDDPATTRRYALRVLAADLTQSHGFLHVYEELLRHTDRSEAFEITMRAKRGIENTGEPGGFVKDHVYLSGIQQVRRAIERDPEAYELLMAAKVPLNLLPALKELRDAAILTKAVYMPENLVG